MKDDIKAVRKLCRSKKLTAEDEFEFCDYIHAMKESGRLGSGKRSDFTYRELVELLEEFLER